MSQTKIHYRDCTAEDIQCLEKFEPEIRRTVAAKGLAGDVCWTAYVAKGQATEYRFFQLYVMTEPPTSLGGDYGEAFLRKASREEFFDWLAGATKSTD